MGLFKRKKKEQEEINESKQAIFTIYAYTKNFNELEKYVQHIFEDTINNIEKINNNLLLTFFDNSNMKISFILDKRETKNQALGMANYFSKVELLDLDLKEKILTQIQMFNYIISISFDLDDNEERTKYLIGSIYMLAEKFSGFVLYPNMYLFHNNGKLLISIDGKTDFTKDNFSPIASSSILEKDIEETENDKNRRLKSIEILKMKNIPYMDKLKCSVYEEEANIWSKEDIIKRLIAIFATSIKAEIYTSGQYDDFEKMTKKALKELEKRYKVFENFTKEEKAYINGEDDNHLKFGWRYECCAILLWALSLEELNEPTKICNVSEMGRLIWNSDFNEILQKSNLKSKQEILDLQDLVFRYNWACVDTILKNQELPQLNREIIYEWHYALNWLVQAYGITDWDNVQTHT